MGVNARERGSALRTIRYSPQSPWVETPRRELPDLVMLGPKFGRCL
jgi:hypothetical protein